MEAPDGLGQQDTDVHRLDLVAVDLLHVVRYGVGDHNLSVGEGWEVGQERGGSLRARVHEICEDISRK